MENMIELEVRETKGDKAALCRSCSAIDFKRLLSSPPPFSSTRLPIVHWRPCRRHLDPTGSGADEDARYSDSKGSTCTCWQCPLCQMFSKVAIHLHRDEDKNTLTTTGAGYQFHPQIYNINGYGISNGVIQLHETIIESMPDRNDSTIAQEFYNREALKLNLPQGTTGALICRLKEDKSNPNTPPRVLEPLLPTPEFDPEKAASYITHCQKYHLGLCRSSGTVRNLRFIDCLEQRIVPAPINSKVQYIALSYRWPPPSQIPDLTSSTLPDLLRTNSCPPIIRDAMVVTTQLEFRYLWVDMFCIDQSSEQDKQEQIAQMDLIYNCAELTIIAAGSDHSLGLRGVTVPRIPNDTFNDGKVLIYNTGPDPWYELSSSEWNSRAWTFQEGLLSRRRLVFTDRQCFFVCNSSFFCDSLAGPGKIPDLESEMDDYRKDLAIYTAAISNQVDRHGFTSMAKIMTASHVSVDPVHSRRARLSKSIMLRNLQTIYRLLEDYTTRQMTNRSDAIKAFLGIFNATLRTKGPVFNICGLPFVLIDGDGRDNLFSISISWRHALNPRGMKSSPRENGLFPSWSWAAWDGKIKFPVLSKDIPKWVSFVSDFAVVKDGSDDSEKVPLEELTAGSVLPSYEKEGYGYLDSLPILQFSGYVIAPECFGFSDSRSWERGGWSICGRPIRFGETLGVEGDKPHGHSGHGYSEEMIKERLGFSSEIFWERINSGEFSCVALGGVSVPSLIHGEAEARDLVVPSHFLVVAGDVERGAWRVGYFVTGLFEERSSKLESLELAQGKREEWDGGTRLGCSCTERRWREATDRRTIRLI